MRDPEASLTFDGDRVIRRLKRALPPTHFLHSELAQQWVARGDLVPFEVHAPDLVTSKRLAFVTHPYEWCDSQLYAAARLTLRLQKEAVEAGYDLKDASAWNVLFDGLRPVFCDLMSFEPLRERKWWAAGQFNRHFVLPLLMSKRRGFLAHESFLAWRDGMPEATARKLLGPRRFLGRHWPLMAEGRHKAVVSHTADVARPAEESVALARFRASLQGGLEWMLRGAAPRACERTVWGDYVAERGHYDRTALDLKRATVLRWLKACEPRAVLDLGCNSGEFSRMAVSTGADVIAVDGDHGAIENLWRQPSERIFPVLCRLDDVSGGRGWAGAEHPGLAQRLRGQVDVVMMLALIHHLSVAAAVPLQAVAEFAAVCSRQWLIVELLIPGDSQLELLCRQRRRSPAEFSLEAQRAAFAASGWRTVEQVLLPGEARELHLMSR